MSIASADEETVGRFFLAPAVLLMAAGALLGGRASDRFGRRRCVLLGEALAALTVAALGVADMLLPAASGPGTFLALFALALDTREAVDAFAAAAIAAGGREVHGAEDEGFMYSRGVEDPDGNGFGPFWMATDTMPSEAEAAL